MNCITLEIRVFRSTVKFHNNLNFPLFRKMLLTPIWSFFFFLKSFSFYFLFIDSSRLNIEEFSFNLLIIKEEFKKQAHDDTRIKNK